MLKISESYASDHNLIFSTDADPNKNKTMYIVFQQKVADIKPVVLCGNPLPWVFEGKHLCNSFDNCKDITDRDIRIKRTKFINRGNELSQELFFACPRKKMKITSFIDIHAI